MIRSNITGAKSLKIKTNIFHKKDKYNNIRVCAVQPNKEITIPISLSDALADLQQLCEDASAYHIDLLVLPEMYGFGYGLNFAQLQASAELVNKYLTTAATLSKKYQMGIIASGASVSDKHQKKLFNSLFYLSQQGQIQTLYHKQFLFGDIEQGKFSPGQTPSAIIEINGVKIGFLICYDGEFPENYRTLALAGTQIIIMPTADFEFHTNINPKREVNINIAHALIPALSLAHEVFVVYVNRSGAEFNTEVGETLSYRGNSVITSPHGDIILAGCFKESALLIADLKPHAYDAVYGEWSYNKDIKQRAASIQS